MDKPLLPGISHNLVLSFLAASAKKERDYTVLTTRKEKTKQFFNESKALPGTSLTRGGSVRGQ